MTTKILLQMLVDFLKILSIICVCFLVWGGITWLLVKAGTTNKIALAWSLITFCVSLLIFILRISLGNWYKNAKNRIYMKKRNP